jgi:diguanylate cyclase (GGDEF)-like protein
MRLGVSLLITIFLLALLVCVVRARSSKKDIKGYVAFLVSGMACPVAGNLILILSTSQLLSTIGCYIYFLGMDIAVYSLLHFTYAYCEMGKPRRATKWITYGLLLIDLVQYILNPFTGFTFTTEMVLVEGLPYYRVVPLLGQTIHRIVCYGILAVSVVVFIVRTVKASHVYREKYAIILLAMIATGALETYYIFSRQPVDMSMIGFAVFGLLVYFFSLHYRSMKLLDRMLAGIASDMPDALYFFDKSGKCIWTNEPGRNLIGVSQNNYDNVKDNLTFLFGDIDFKSSGWFKRVTLGTGDETLYTHLAMRSIVDEKGQVTGTYLSVRDITEEQRELKREMYNSTHDSLTGFYTKEYLFEQIDQRLHNDHETDYMIGYMEIANLKIINDVFGSRFAELTIKKAAELILEGISKKSLYGRIGDDAFGILIDKKDFESKPVDEKLSNLIVSDNGLNHHILINYGVYDISENDEIDVPLFFNSARLATTVIKNNTKNPVAFYDDKLREEIIHNQMISNQVTEAIKTRQIKPYLQPIVDSRGMLVGAEALVRWIHPEEGFMNPSDFIPVFEHNGLITIVDRHMWKCACEILADWKSRNIDSFISINISPKDFFFMDVVKELESLVEEYGIKPEKLRIEITETVVANGSVNVFEIVTKLREYGFIVEMDDFGSGYSSLNLLKDLNFDVIKIDMKFLKDSERNMKAGLIINHIINMAEDLGMETLTEGVETAKQFEKLFAMGCKLYQGYYFSKPVPLSDFEKQWFE